MANGYIQWNWVPSGISWVTGYPTESSTTGDACLKGLISTHRVKNLSKGYKRAGILQAPSKKTQRKASKEKENPFWHRWLFWNWQCFQGWRILSPTVAFKFGKFCLSRDSLTRNVSIHNLALTSSNYLKICGKFMPIDLPQTSVC